MKMRIAIAEIKQESDTFSPVPCTLKDFEQNGLYYDTNFLDKMKGVGEIGGFLDALKEEGMDLELVPILRANGTCSGRVEMAVLHFLTEKLVSGLKEALPLDGIFLSFHGAASAEKIDDVEGYLLAAVRRVVGDKIPLVVTLDHHANITKQMTELTDLMVGYETSPHQPYYTGKKAASLLFSLLKKKFMPVLAWEKIPLIVGYLERMYTGEEGPMKEWFDLARELEKKLGVISISNFPMQPWLDVEEAGSATVVYTDNKPELAKELASELSNKAWDLRERFWKKSDRLSPIEAIRHAVEAEAGPIFISDPSDNVFCGAPGDSTCLLKEMLRQGIECTALIPMYDPEVVAEAMKAGKGSEITVNIGGKSDNIFYEPVEVTGRVTGISEGFEIDPRESGQFDMRLCKLMVQRGTIVLEVGSIILLVSESRMMAGSHPGIYRHFGIEPAEAKIIVASTFDYYQSIIKGLIIADCPGFAQADLTQFEWVRAPRPLYPMDKDKMDSWKANPSVKQSNMGR